MTNFFRGVSLLFLFPLFTGCAIGVPQNRDEFVSMYKDAHVFGNAEHITVNRPAKAVVADVKEFSQRCLNKRIVNPPNFSLQEAGGPTTFRPKIEKVGNDATALTLQEEYNDRHMPGTPQDGLYTLVAEIRPADKNQTNVHIYYPRGSKVVDPLKQWADGDRCPCPSLKRGW